MRIDTITVVTDSGEVVINATDYDPGKHKLPGAKKADQRKKAAKPMSKQA